MGKPGDFCNKDYFKENYVNDWDKVAIPEVLMGSCF